MDIGWYKENIALQAELRREYPAVAELIDELEQQLSRYQGAVEVEGVVWHRELIHSNGSSIVWNYDDGQRVRVMVIKEVE